jgi:hypothetical protein
LNFADVADVFVVNSTIFPQSIISDAARKVRENLKVLISVVPSKRLVMVISALVSMA